MFTTQDVQQFESIGITLEKAETQVNDLKNGYPFLKIKGAAAIGDGVLSTEVLFPIFYVQICLF